MIVEYPLRIFLDLSTAHLNKEDRDYLSTSNAEFQWVAKTPYGSFVYADEENGSGDIPDNLFAIMKKAREMQAEYILFNCDAATWPDLEIFDDE